MYDPSAGSDIERIQDWLESIGVDDYTLKVNTPEILSNALSLLRSIHKHLAGSPCVLISAKTVEHNRSYGNSSHYGLSITVSVPRQKHSTTVSSKRRGKAIKDVAETEGDKSGTEPGSRYTPDIPGLTEVPNGSIVVPRGDSDGSSDAGKVDQSRAEPTDKPRAPTSSRVKSK